MVVEETLAIKEKFATPRKTVILTEEKPGDAIVTEADLAVPEGPQVLVVTTQGVQRNDAKGFSYRVKPGVTSRAVEAHRMHLRTEPEDTVVLVSDRGRVWWGAVGRLPRSAAFGALGLGKGERIVGTGLFTDECCLVLGTRQGRVKRVKAEDVKSTAEASWAGDHRSGRRRRRCDLCRRRGRRCPGDVLWHQQSQPLCRRRRQPPGHRFGQRRGRDQSAAKAISCLAGR